MMVVGIQMTRKELAKTFMMISNRKYPPWSIQKNSVLKELYLLLFKVADCTP